MTVGRWSCVLFLIAAGCDGRSVVPVSGRVTFNGEPVENAIVLFQPIDDRENPGTGSTGRTDVDGRFTLRQIQPDRPGAWPGKHRVRITRAPMSGQPEHAPAPQLLLLIEKPPFEVPAGGMADADFQLPVKKN